LLLEVAISRFWAAYRRRCASTGPFAIASGVGLPLKFAAKVDWVDEAYFRSEITPLLDRPGIEFVGEIGERQKTRFLGDARSSRSATLLGARRHSDATLSTSPCVN
jgi:hypothetical protein